MAVDAGWELAAGQAFGEYRIERPLGRGGMGAVYEAVQISLERRVALKVITPQLSSDPDFLEMFREEARLAAALDHPNVLPIYHAGAGPDGRLFVAMRLAAGGDLAEHLHRVRRLAPPEAVRILAQVGAALDAAHDAGMVHRDVKPANVLLERRSGDQQAYLSDFGLARRLTDRPDDGDRAAGTPAYMAPEQVEGGDVDRRADVYAFGCLVHRCLTGAVPFRRQTHDQILIAHLNAPIPRPSAAVAGVPPALDAVVVRALAKDPADRPESAGALIGAAAAELGVRPIAARPEPRERTRITVPARPRVPGASSAAARTRTPARRRRGGQAVAWAAVGALVALAATAVAVALPALLAERDETAVVADSLAGLRLSAQAARAGAGIAAALPRIAPADGGDGGEARVRLAKVTDDMAQVAAATRHALSAGDPLQGRLLRASHLSSTAATALDAVAADPYGASSATELATARTSFADALTALRGATGESRRRLERAGRLESGDTSLIDAVSADLVRAGDAVDEGFAALEQRLGS